MRFRSVREPSGSRNTRVVRRRVGGAGRPTLVSLLAAWVALAAAHQDAFAGGGDFAVDFIAAAPFTYDHGTGGGAYNDRTIGKANDVVESLEGGDFECGDIVTFLPRIVVTGDGGDDPQIIELDFSFLADTTGQSGAAVSDIVAVLVNYGSVLNGDGPGGTDYGIVDDGGSVARLTSEVLTGPLFTRGSELLGTVEVDDLEMGGQVVVRIDVQIVCDAGSTLTGNLQAGLADARVIHPVSEPVGGGVQR